MLIGFLFVLILSDNLEPATAFAKQFKNIYILMLFLFFLLDRKNFQPLNRLFIYFIPFFIIAAFCLQYSPVLNISIQKLFSYLLLFIIIPNYLIRSYNIQGEYFFKNFMYFVLVILLVCYFIRFIDFDIAVSHGGRLRGIFGNPNGLGIFITVIFLLFNIITVYFPTLFYKQEKWIFYVIFIFLAYKTGSRNTLLSIILFLSLVRIFKISTFLGIIFFIIFTASAQLFLDNYNTIIIALGLEEVFRLDTLDQASGRLIAWQFAWENIQKSLFLGKGFAFDEYLMRSNFDYLSKLGHQGGVHNTYLIIWLNTGLIGILAYFRGFLLLFIKAAKNSHLAIPVMLSIMFSINFEPWLAASLNPFTIIFLMIITIMIDPIFNTIPNEASHNQSDLLINQNNVYA
jgi:O-antigen ligase